MVLKVGRHIECGDVHRGHVVSARGFYCGRFGCLADFLSEMGMCWTGVGSVCSCVGNVICMWL